MLKKMQSILHDKSRRPIVITIGCVLALMLLLIISRIWASITLNDRTDQNAIRLVHTFYVKKTVPTERLVLPGSLAAWHASPIYARTNGYIKEWNVDIGYKVQKGDLLAVIETPELDAQLRQAEADLNAAIANNELAQLTATRWMTLLKSDTVSKQATDEKIQAAKALSATVAAQRANRDKLSDLVSFAQIKAPFSGIIAMRGIDVGDLINAGSNANAKPLFKLVQTDKLRLYVKIPELYSSRIISSMTVDMQFAEHPGRIFQAQLLKTSGALDPKTRTLLAEFMVHNETDLLLPGSYTEVTFSLAASPLSVVLPVNALLFRQEGLQVAKIDKNNRVVLKNIQISRDFGSEVEVSSHIDVGEQLVINPPDSIYNGEVVNVITNLSLGDKKSPS
ncbi:MAG: efflux transporter periplasmic adaptor subunit [Legionella sp.]|nr:MAG: efflux transporter periplasmic adaptor subunit [Legionella sp.]